MADEAADAEFRLRPYEDAIGGVKWRNGHLRLRPSLGARALSICSLLVVGLIVLAVAIDGAIFGYIVAVLAVAQGVFLLRHLGCRVDAQSDVVTVTNRWRRRAIPARDIRTVALQGYEPDFGFLPFAGPTTLWPREFRVGTLVLRTNEQVRCDALVGLPRGQKDNLPTQVEQKTDILNRWLAITKDHEQPLSLLPGLASQLPD